MQSRLSRHRSAGTLPLPLLVIVFALLAGCASVNNQMASWQGRPQADVVQKWGPPTRTASDGADGTILIYDYVNLGQPRGEAFVPPQGYAIPDGAIWYTAPQEAGYVARRMFWIDASGKVYDERWHGL